MVNKVILIGNLGKNPEVRNLESGSKVAGFTLATSESYKDKNTGERKTITEWHNITVFGKLAEIVESYVKKGSKVYIEGKLKTESYEQNGEKKYITKVIANNLTMMDTKQQSDNNGIDSIPSISSNMIAEESEDLPF